ncbi:MAG: hypothetical protein NXI31_08920 [bacterium]|nr:hypothetical protein [bacterium]
MIKHRLFASTAVLFAAGVVCLSAVRPSVPQDPQPAASQRRPNRIAQLEARVAEHPNDLAALRRLGRAYFFAARRGEKKLVDKSVTTLEKLRQLDPDRDVHRDLGTAYLTQLAYLLPKGAAALERGDKQTEQRKLQLVKRARTEFDAGAKLHPQDARMQSGIGLTMFLQAIFEQDYRTIPKAMQALNRAVEMAPDQTHPRLARGLTLMPMPPSMGASEVVVGDLERLVRYADGQKNGQVAGVLQVFIGDVLTLADKPDQARAAYEGAAKRKSSAAATARARLRVLDADERIPRQDILDFRGQSLDCAVCHSR